MQRQLDKAGMLGTFAFSWESLRLRRTWRKRGSQRLSCPVVLVVSERLEEVVGIVVLSCLLSARETAPDEVVEVK